MCKQNDRTNLCLAISVTQQLFKIHRYCTHVT